MFLLLDTGWRWDDWFDVRSADICISSSSSWKIGVGELGEIKMIGNFIMINIELHFIKLFAIVMWTWSCRGMMEDSVQRWVERIKTLVRQPLPAVYQLTADRKQWKAFMKVINCHTWRTRTLYTRFNHDKMLLLLCGSWVSWMKDGEQDKVKHKTSKHKQVLLGYHLASCFGCLLGALKNSRSCCVFVLRVCR